MNLNHLKHNWVDTPEYHSLISQEFAELVDATPDLKAHREWVSSRAHGFGEKSFWWLWKLILDELPENPNLCEVGVYMGATLSVWRLLKPEANIYGITPLDSSDGHIDVPYLDRIQQIHDEFKQRMPILYVGRSDNEAVIEMAKQQEYDLIYLDGGHSREVVDWDLATYPQMIKSGGYLVIDDCNNNLNFPPSGFFTGIQSVTDAKLAWLATNPDFDFICSVVHISVFQRR